MKTKLLPLLLFTFATNVSALTTPTEDFIDNNDGTVTHKKTGLTWKRCSEGQEWDGYDCLGIGKNYKTSDISNITSSFANQTNWRVPNIRELLTLVEYDVSKPSINQEIFPRTPSDKFHSITKPISSPTYSRYVDFSFGHTASSSSDKYVRLVRGKMLNEGKLAADFIKNADGTATDQTKNLIWKRCLVGHTWNGIACEGNPSRLVTSDLTEVEKDGFRLPTSAELLSIVDFSTQKPSINTTIFPNNPSSMYDVRSSSESFNPNVSFRLVNFDLGQSGIPSSTGGLFVRLVKTGVGQIIQPSTTPPSETPIVISPIMTQPTSNADLIASITAPQSSIPLNQNITYTASISNKGTGTANNVSVLFMMPPRWTNYVSVPSDCSTNGAVTTCSIGSVNAGANVSRSMTVNFSRRGATSVGALVKSNDDTNDSNNMSRVVTTITK